MTGLLERALIGLCEGTPTLGAVDLKSRVKIGMNSFVSEKIGGWTRMGPRTKSIASKIHFTLTDFFFLFKN